jgi:hypothetical protein
MMAAIVFSLAIAIPIVGGVVLLVRRMLRGHQLSEEELDRLERDQREPVSSMMLPTLTTEVDAKVARDPDFELDASTVRNRQGF